MWHYNLSYFSGFIAQGQQRQGVLALLLQRRLLLLVAAERAAKVIPPRDEDEKPKIGTKEQQLSRDQSCANMRICTACRSDVCVMYATLFFYVGLKDPPRRVASFRCNCKAIVRDKNEEPIQVERRFSFASCKCTHSRADFGLPEMEGDLD